MKTALIALLFFVGCTPKTSAPPKVDSLKTEPSPRKNPLDTDTTLPRIFTGKPKQ